MRSRLTSLLVVIGASKWLLKLETRRGLAALKVQLRCVSLGVDENMPGRQHLEVEHGLYPVQLLVVVDVAVDFLVDDLVDRSLNTLVDDGCAIGKTKRES